MLNQAVSISAGAERWITSVEKRLPFHGCNNSEKLVSAKPALVKSAAFVS